MLRTIGIRELKNKLSGCLRDVQRGDVYLVADRGRVVAELRLPSVQAPALEGAPPAFLRQVAEGKMRAPSVLRGEGHRKAVTLLPRIRLVEKTIREALDWTRGDR